MPPKLSPDRLLAKSVEGRWKGSYSLVGHTADVVRAVTTLVDTLGDRILEQSNLPCSLDYLRNTVRLAAYIHDWGKANNHFQGVVRQKMSGASPQRNPMQTPQLLRHEILSLLIAWEFRDWLKDADGDFMTAFVAAGGHHLKLGGKQGKATDEIGEIRICGDDRVTLYLRHPDFKRVIRFGKKQLNCPQKVKLASSLKPEWSLSEIKQRRESLLIDGLVDWEQESSVLTAVVKALLVAGDAVGSAIPAATTLHIDHWIKNALANTLTEQDLENVIQARLKGYSLRDFQIKLGNITKRVGLARAGCGTGKTVGAYNWAKRHAIGRKLFVCYPTTGTSTEGFLDYVQDEVKSVLLHGRAEVDLAMAQTGEEAEVVEGDEAIPNEADLKLTSFKAWDKQAIVCTVDTVLGLTQCNRRPIYSFPAMANAAFVFDEVHCYDNALFGALLRFLETVKAPTLLMSASFLPAQLAAIEKAVGDPIEIVQGPKDLEIQPRYRFHFAEEPNWERVEAELAKGGKVLWVCNQVNTAIAVYEEAQQRNLNSLLYHSRFCYYDRVKHHRAVVDAFKPEYDQPVLAIATQVAEMSLDLSATLLVSQIAEPPALIQRLGRLNRKYCGHALEAWFYPDPKTDRPYSQEQLKQGQALVDAFSTGDINQADLAGWLEQQANTNFQPKTQSVWLDGEWRTYPASLRESGVTVTCLMAHHKSKWATASRSQLNLYTVPLVVDTKQAAKWERHKYFPIAPVESFGYDPSKGAFSLKQSKGGDA